MDPRNQAKWHNCRQFYFVGWCQGGEIHTIETFRDCASCHSAEWVGTHFGCYWILTFLWQWEGDLLQTAWVAVLSWYNICYLLSYFYLYHSGLRTQRIPDRTHKLMGQWLARYSFIVEAGFQIHQHRERFYEWQLFRACIFGHRVKWERNNRAPETGIEQVQHRV